MTITQKGRAKTVAPVICGKLAADRRRLSPADLAGLKIVSLRD